MALWGVEDADVLRVLELLDAGESRKAIQLQHLPHIDALALLRIVRNKDAQSVRGVVERHPEWHAKQQRQQEQQQSERAAHNGDRNETDAEVNAYEAKRLQRMRENQEKMLALGLQKLAPARERAKRKADPAALDAAWANPRRSARISSHTDRSASAAQPAPSSAEQDDLLAAALHQRRIQRRRTSAAVPAYDDLDLPVVDLRAATTQQPSDRAVALTAAAAGARVKREHQSSQLLDIELEHFHARWLGKQIWPRGKATIMRAMSPLHTPRFSNMSGVQSWNNAIVLFVNVQGASRYDNVFQHAPARGTTAGTTAAVSFQWFAQQRQHLESPVIVRMLNAQRGDAELRLNDATYDRDESPSRETAATHDPVLLFIRHVDGPYIYCGRLGYLGYRPDSSPLEFRWQLLDAAALEWRTIERLIASSSARVDSAAVTEGGSP